VLDGLPGGHPAQAVPGGQFALGGHRRVDGQLVLDEVEQDLRSWKYFGTGLRASMVVRVPLLMMRTRGWTRMAWT
jgi:hypothetical protein